MKIVQKYVAIRKSLNSNVIWETKIFLMMDAMIIAQSKRILHAIRQKTMKVFVNFKEVFF